jgi:WD40 repeat protein
MTDRDLFIAALEHADPAARGDWLTDACPDPETRRRVELLLKAHDQASRFLAVPADGELAADAPTRTGHPADETTPAAEIDVRAFLAPSDVPGHLGRLAHFEILEIVGRGGMGLVLKALDPKLHRLVAVKLMAPHLAASSAARRRFEREAKAVAAVKNEHVVAIHDVQPDAAAPYLVMEFIAGPSLQDRLERSGPLEVKEVLRIGMQAASGLAAAHKQGLVHRDVKPANILLENGVERVKLTDFGLARAADDANLTQSGVITGTPNYMSPEQANGAAVDARSDLFSLGSVLYALCAGHPPFRADTAMAVLKRVCDDDPRPLPEVNTDVPPWLDAIVRKLLAKDPNDRFQTATEVAELLGQHLAHLQNPAAAPMPATVAVPTPHRVESAWTQIYERSDRPKRLLQIGLLLGGAILIFAGGALIARGHEGYPLYPGVAMVFVAGLIHQRWSVPYKGRTIRFEHSVVTGLKLFVDDVRIARDQVLRRVELRGTVPPGPGAGDEVRADVEAGFARIACRILVREAVHAAPGPIPPAPAPAAATPPLRWPDPPPAVGCVIGVALLVAVGTALAFRDALGNLIFEDGFFAPIFLGVATLVLGLATWLLPKLPSPHGLDSKPSRFTLGLAFVFAASGIAAGWVVWARHIGAREKAVDGMVWAMLGIAASTLVVNVPVLLRRRRPTEDPTRFRRERRIALLVVISFGAMAVTSAGRLIIEPLFDKYPDRLVVKWNHAFVDRVTIERYGEVIDDFRGEESVVGYPYESGVFTVRGYLRGTEVYHEDVRLVGGQKRVVSLFDDRVTEAEPALRVDSDDIGHQRLTFTMTSSNHSFRWSGTWMSQQLVPYLNYQFQATRGQTVIHEETIRLTAGERRTIHFPQIRPAAPATKLKPVDGSFPADVVRMQFSPDGSLVAAARLDGPILVFDTATGRERFTVRRVRSDCSAFGFTPNGKLLAYVGREGNTRHGLHLVSAADGQSVETLVSGPNYRFTNSHALAFSPDGSRVAAATAFNVGPDDRFNSRLLRWELAAKKGASLELQPIEGISGEVAAIVFGPSNKVVRAVSGTQATDWDWTTRAVHGTSPGFEIDSLAPGKVADLATGWNAETNLAVAWLWPHGSSTAGFRELTRNLTRFGGAAVSADGSRVALGTKGAAHGPWESRAAVDVYDVATRKPVVRFLGHTDWVMDVAFHPDGKEVISAGKDGTVRTWRLPE